MSIRGTVELDDILHTQRLEYCRDSQAAHRVDAVDGYCEIGLLDSRFVHKFEAQDIIYMVGQIILVGDSAQVVHISKDEVFFFSNLIL